MTRACAARRAAAGIIDPMQLLGYVTWDGSNADELRSLTPDRFEGTWETSALVRNAEDHLVHVQPGWTVSAWDGIPGRDAPGVLTAAPMAWEIILALALAAGQAA